MDYNGNICAGCQKPFTDGDDIVVCPECGTPQHRECYEKENRCVNSEKHSEGFMWQGTVTKEKPTFVKTERVNCPNCGIDNPKGSTVCRNCGMKFTVFGMNVVDALHEEEKRNSNQNSDIPHYDAPFSLGEGEGFDKNASAPEQNASPDQVEGMLTDILSGQSQNTEANGRINLGGPFPAEDEIDGVMTNNIGNFIGANAMSYISKFKKIQSGKKISFNFAAFFLAPYWFFYRKLYKAGIIFMTAFLAVSILMIPSSLELTEYVDQFLVTVQSAAETVTEAQLMEIYNGMLDKMAPAFVFVFIAIVIRFLCGFCANHIYKKYVTENAGTAERMNSRNSAMAYMVKNGGASLLIAFGAFCVNEVISVLISYLL